MTPETDLESGTQPPSGWLEASLREAAEKVRQMPQWVRDLHSATSPSFGGRRRSGL